jgi:hypothetical protein
MECTLKVELLLNTIDKAMWYRHLSKSSTPLPVDISNRLRRILGEIHSIMIKPVNKDRDNEWKISEIDRKAQDLAEIFPYQKRISPLFCTL